MVQQRNTENGGPVPPAWFEPVAIPVFKRSNDVRTWHIATALIGMFVNSWCYLMHFIIIIVTVVVVVVIIIIINF